MLYYIVYSVFLSYIPMLTIPKLWRQFYAPSSCIPKSECHINIIREPHVPLERGGHLCQDMTVLNGFTIEVRKWGDILEDQVWNLYEKQQDDVLVPFVHLWPEIDCWCSTKSRKWLFSIQDPFRIMKNSLTIDVCMVSYHQWHLPACSHTLCSRGCWSSHSEASF